MKHIRVKRPTLKLSSVQIEILESLARGGTLHYFSDEEIWWDEDDFPRQKPVLKTTFNFLKANNLIGFSGEEQYVKIYRITDRGMGKVNVLNKKEYAF